MNLDYEITDISYSYEEWGMKEDVGGRKIVTYTLTNNGEKIGEYTYDDENVPEDELVEHYLQHLIENKLSDVMKQLNKVIPDEV